MPNFTWLELDLIARSASITTCIYRLSTGTRKVERNSEMTTAALRYVWMSAPMGHLVRLTANFPQRPKTRSAFMLEQVSRSQA